MPSTNSCKAIQNFYCDVFSDESVLWLNNGWGDTNTKNNNCNRDILNVLESVVCPETTTNNHLSAECKKTTENTHACFKSDTLQSWICLDHNNVQNNDSLKLPMELPGDAKCDAGTDMSDFTDSTIIRPNWSSGGTNVTNVKFYRIPYETAVKKS